MDLHFDKSFRNYLSNCEIEALHASDIDIEDMEDEYERIKCDKKIMKNVTESSGSRLFRQKNALGCHKGTAGRPLHYMVHGDLVARGGYHPCHGCRIDVS